MTITWNTNLPQSYVDLRYAAKRLFEGFEPRPYLDSVGIPTVGVGFNLRDRDVRNNVLFELGFRDEALSGAEQAYKDQIAAAVNLTYSTGQETTHLQPRVDAILSMWANDPSVTTRDLRLKRSTLTLSEAESRLVLDRLARDVYERVVDRIIGTIPLGGGVSGLVPQSRERLALVSLAFNNANTLLGPGLVAALRGGNRAEAWFQIRYASNGGNSASVGIAKRRFEESEIFGLYDNPAAVSSDEAKVVYGMLQSRRTAIYQYEARWGLTPDGQRGSQTSRGLTALEIAQQEIIDPLNAAVASVVDNGRIDSLFDNLIPARDALVGWLNTQLPPDRQIDAAIINPAAVYCAAEPAGTAPRGQVLDARGEDGKAAGMEHNLLAGGRANDVLRGGAGDDWLVGGAGNDHLDGGSGHDELHGGEDADTLEGGTGDDVLLGGAGQDTYVWNAGDGDDTIVDADGGRFIVNGNGYSFGGGIMVQSGNADVWSSTDGNVTLTRDIAGSNAWRLEMAGGSTIYLGQQFDPVMWGITLRDAVPSALQPPQTTRAIEGDWTPTGAIEYDEWGNRIVTATPAPDRNDTLFDGASNELIQAGGGHDNVYGPDGGDDHFKLGSGHDAGLGGAGNDLIEGEAGWDILAGGAGRDTLKGGADEDRINGGTGADVIDGSSVANDAMFIERRCA